MLGKEGVGQKLAVLLKIFLVIRLEVGVQSGKAVCESVAVIRRSSVFNSGFRNRNGYFLGLAAGGSVFAVLLQNCLVKLVAKRFNVALIKVLRVKIVFRRALILSVVLRKEETQFNAVYLNSDFTVITRIVDKRFSGLLIDGYRERILFNIFGTDKRKARLGNSTVNTLHKNGYSIV